MSALPKFSVVIAVYNGAKTLPETLECVARQTRKDFELVIVNDESTDNSEEVIRSFQKANPSLSIQYLAQKNRGLGGARNAGMRQANGEWIALLDQDDLWYPAKLERVGEAFEQYPAISFVGHPLYRRVGGKVTQALHCDFMAENSFHRLLFGGNHFCGSAMSFRKAVTGPIGFFSEDRERLYMSEDYDYWLRGAARGLKFFVVNEILGEYVVHSRNFSRNRNLMYRNEWNVVKEHYRRRPSPRWGDSLWLAKRRGKILARQALSWVKA